MRECARVPNSLFINEPMDESRLYPAEGFPSPSVDDLFAMDSQLLLQTADEIDTVEDSVSPSLSDTISPFTSDLDFESDFLRGTSAAIDLFNLEFNDYSSSNSCDSGKHSPSGSESLSDHSPWGFGSEPTTSTVIEQQEYEGSSYSDNLNTDFQTNLNQSSPIQNSTISQDANSRPEYVYYVPKQDPRSLSQTPVQLNVKTQVLVKQAPHTKKEQITQKPQVFISNNNGLQIRNYQAIPQPTTQCFQIATPSPAIVNLSQNVEVDDYRRRQEDRKMKNRAAAQASRLKKRNEADEMKSKLAKLEEENQRLKMENANLRKRLELYEPKKIENWASAPSRKRTAIAGACVMAFFMMVSISPINLESRTTSRTYRESHTADRISHGKVLKYNDPVVDTVPQNESISCGFKKSWLNKTETIRLNTDLYNWVDRHEQMDLSLKRGKRVLLRNGPKSWPAAAMVERVDMTDLSLPKRTGAEKREHAKQTAIRDRAWKHLDMISQSSDTLRDKRDRARKLMKLDRQIQEQAPTKEQYEKLATSIQHRPDTLYVVTMKDYFLLPAVTRNETTRPRIALILPALSLNGTLTSQVSMMRIDLDVVGTGLFHLSKELVPLFFT